MELFIGGSSGYGEIR